MGWARCGRPTAAVVDLSHCPPFRPLPTRLSLGGLDPAVAFSRINNAYSVLVDDYERTRFHAMETMLEEDISRLGEIKRRNAMLDVELMQVSERRGSSSQPPPPLLACSRSHCDAGCIDCRRRRRCFVC